MRKALKTLEELPDPILKQCTMLTKHYQSCLDIIVKDFNGQNYEVIGEALDKAARGTWATRKTRDIFEQHTHSQTLRKAAWL